MELSGLASLVHQKILLYQDLLDVLKKEKMAIVKIDVDALWKISDRKQKIASELEALRIEILGLLDGASIPHQMSPTAFDLSKIVALLPDDMGTALSKANLALVPLKQEIQALLDENKRFVGEYLTVLDELIGVIAHADVPEPIYAKSKRSRRTAANLFLNREV